jgi:hypothetical protein
MSGVAIGIYVERSPKDVVDSQLSALIDTVDQYLRMMGTAQHTFDRIDSLIAGMFLVGTSYWSEYHILLAYAAVLSLITSDISHRMPGKHTGVSLCCDFIFECFFKHVIRRIASLPLHGC